MMGIIRFFVCLFLLLLSTVSFASDYQIDGVPFSLGYGHSCALHDTGVVCWGWNVYGQTDVPSLSNPTQVSLGLYHTCAIDDTGVVCWGYNEFGQTDVPSLSNPTQVSLGYGHTCAIDDAGVVCWGNNDYGHTDVPSLSNPTQVSSGVEHACALDDTGVVCWGDNGYGQTDVPSLSNPTQVSLGNDHSCALDDTGVICWGRNSEGQIDVPTLSNPRQVSFGSYHSCASDDTGVVCWGNNSSGQTDVPSLSNPTQVSLGFDHSCALDDTGVVCWGNNDYGQTDVPELTLYNHIAPEITSVQTVNAIDESTDNNQVIYTAVANTPIATFRLAEGSDSALSINATTGVVSLAGVPDFETQEEYSFSIIASTSLGDSAATNQTLSINNLDEVAPTITSGNFAAAINESSDVGQVIYTATVDDSADISGGVTFSLSGDNASNFSISNDEATFGQVSLVSQLAVGQYSFDVLATDKADNVSILNDVSVTVEDGLAFRSGDAAAVNENVEANSLIYTAETNKDDVTFSLSEGSDSELSIDSATGEVTLSERPSFEDKSQYTFTVIATSVESGSKEQEVTLSINNLDEFAPTITSSGVANAINEADSTKQEDVSGQVVYTAVADDSADVSNGFTFSLSGDDAASFSISNDAQTLGQVKLDGNPNYEGQSSYAFDVIATDEAGNASAAQSVSLAINNIDEVAPTITSSSDAVSVDGNGAPQVVYTATAEDSDFNGSEEITFSLSGADADNFSIDSDSGAVTFEGGADYFIKPAYSFNVIATDATGNASAKAVTLDVNRPPLDIISLDEISQAVIKPQLQADTQHIYVSEISRLVNGTQVEVKLSYLVDDPTLTGVGFTLNFDSSALSLDSVTDVANNGAIVRGTLNADGDGLTFAWADPFGEAWPGSTEAELATVTFNIAEGATGPTALDIVKTSGMVGYEFDGQSQQVAMPVGAGSRVIYKAETNHEGAIFALQDNTNYPLSVDIEDSVVTVPELQVSTQHVYVSESTKSDDGTQVTVKLAYLVDDPTLTGFGFTLNFDSSILSLDSVTDVANNGAIARGTLNADGNGLTFAWADPFGEAWPGSVEAELATVTFNVAEGTIGSTVLDIVKTSGMVGFEFDGQSHAVAFDSQLNINSTTGEVTLYGDPLVSEYDFTVIATIEDETVEQDVFVYVDVNNGYSILDFDANGSVDALTDGLLLLRHTFGLRGASLTNDSIASNSSLSPEEVEQRVERSYSISDIDNNGNVDPLTDGLLVLRYLFGLRGESLINDVISENAFRTEAFAVEAYIESLMPSKRGVPPQSISAF